MLWAVRNAHDSTFHLIELLVNADLNVLGSNIITVPSVLCARKVRRNQQRWKQVLISDLSARQPLTTDMELATIHLPSNVAIAMQSSSIQQALWIDKVISSSSAQNPI